MNILLFVVLAGIDVVGFSQIPKVEIQHVSIVQALDSFQFHLDHHFNSIGFKHRDKGIIVLQL